MSSPSDITSASAVSDTALGILARLFPKASDLTVRQLFADADQLFNGRHPDYQACDLKYHDYRHTLQVTNCFVQLFAGRAAESELTARQLELGLAAALYHDSGYLKTRADHEGTGAKYTYCHVLRSCALAASHLPARGFSLEELDAVLGAIRRTGPFPVGNVARFRNADEEFLANAVASSDYLAQMSASDYPDELKILYAEFEESDNFVNMPPARRTFKSASDLAERTSKFWMKVVRPKLEKDFLGVYRHLAAADGPNLWLNAIEANLAYIAARAAANDKRAAAS